MNRKKISVLTTGALIAAVYAVLTYASAFFGLAYSGVQFRLSEALTVLPVFTPVAIPGLLVGCILGNITSPYGIVDIICGAGASLLAAVLSYLLRGVKVKGIPVLSMLMPIIANAVVVGWEISYFMPEGFTLPVFLAQGGLVALGEFVVILVLGTPFYLFLNKKWDFQKNK